MGCCKSSGNAVAGPANHQSLLVADHNSPVEKAKPDTQPSRPTSKNSNISSAGMQEGPITLPGKPKSVASLASHSSPVPAGPRQTQIQPPQINSPVNIMSPGNSSVSSWDGDGTGIWRVCNGDVSPNPLSSILEERNAEEMEARAAMAALINEGVDRDSPFFRSVASAEASPAADILLPISAGSKTTSPSVLSSIMLEKASNHSNTAKNPMMNSQAMTPSLDGSPFFRSVSSVDGGSPPTKLDKDEMLKNNPLSLDFDLDYGGIERRQMGSENCPPKT